ncbi:LysM peptidoglycan-binding domain-containing protein [Bacillus tuaregi]|uniref:LysM peptidoglycan-binding domain-containing protein n=1 Tax=Bacillus tuaregi TaxID=1816695 RepID=UPI0008F7FCD0|nr:LysM peptidoglycan-binding domain-containing protein [Bacillus tuaregi]
MNKEDPYRDQVERRRQKIKPADFPEGQVVDREELPPRSRVHQQKRKKNKWKLKYPVIRLLVLFFILLPITIFSIYSAMTKDKIGDSEPVVGESTDGFEFIDIEDSKDSDVEEPVELKNENSDTVEEDNAAIQDVLGNEQASDLEQQDMIEKEAVVSNVLGESNDVSLQTHSKETVYHTVKPGETIFKISMMYYKSKSGIDTIKATNGLTSNEIRVGQVLIIPLNK